MIIDKKYYLDLIKNYKNNLNIKDNYIFIYTISRQENLNTFIEKSAKELNYSIINFPLNKKSSVEYFIYLFVNSKAIITNSYHGTIFSIIFNKPFISFHYKGSARERLISLGKLLGVKERIFDYNENPNIKLLITPLKINNALLNILRNKSINFIKKNIYTL